MSSDPTRSVDAGPGRRAVLAGGALGVASFALPAAAAAASGASFALSATAQFDTPYGVDVDASGNVYVADYGNHRIRRITGAGVVSTLAGSGTAGATDDTGTAASFSSPYDVAVTGSGDVYVADFGNHRIRRVTAAGVVTTFAGSTSGYVNDTGTAARFVNPGGIVPDGSGGFLVTEYNGNRVRSITAGAVVALVAGSTSGAAGFTDGTGGAARFTNPQGITMSGGDAYVMDSANAWIRRVTTAGVVSTVLSSGFNFPYCIVADGSGGFYVTDALDHRVYAVSSSFVVTTLAGSGSSGFADGTGAAAQFATPIGIAIHPSTGDLYVADSGNHRIRRVTQAGVVTTFAGTGVQGFADD